MGYLDQFHYQVLGDQTSPKLVFLHGLMGSLANWRKITSSLKDIYQILTFDQRGHGRSFQPASGYAPEDYAKDLFYILDELRWEKVHLVGHSMGGRNALVFADLYPERLESLVLEDISPENDPESVQRIEFLLSQVPTPFASKAEAKLFFQEEFSTRINQFPNAKDLANYFYSNIEEKSGGGADWRFSLKGIRESLLEGRKTPRWRELESLKLPSLLIRGEKSKDLSREVFQQMLQRSPHLRGVEILGAGHWVHFDQSEKFLQALKGFWDGELENTSRPFLTL